MVEDKEEILDQEESSEEVGETSGTVYTGSGTSGTSSDYSAILEEMNLRLENTETSTSELSDNLLETNVRLDYLVTFMFAFACAAFIIFIWRIFYGWFYKSV